MNMTVTGAGGFIGGHLTARLAAEGHDVRGFDIKPLEEWYQRPIGVLCYEHADVGAESWATVACKGTDWVFNLAADMGGMGFIENNKLDCMMSVLPSTHMLQAAAVAGVGRFFYSSSACVYAADKQTNPDVAALREEDAYPAMAEDGYGWEKLFTERMCRHYSDDGGLDTHVARYHNVYGPHGTWDGGREKAPAALCRKVAEAVVSGRHEIAIWGDGEQTRSFMWIDDCIEGTLRIMRSEVAEPLNLGSAELVSVNQLVTIIEQIAGVELERTYDLSAPQGVRGRNSDNTRIRAELGWEPATPLAVGLERLYAWVYDQVQQRG